MIEREETYKLVLNHITNGETIRNATLGNENFEDYKRAVLFFLGNKGIVVFEEDILKQFDKEIPLDVILSNNPHRYIPGMPVEIKGKLEKTWFDLWAMEEIEREDFLFDYFFICKLRQVNIMKIDMFLEFHLEHSFKDHLEEFTRFLQLAIRKHHHKLLNSDFTETVAEWVKMKEAIKEIETPRKHKGIKREAGDNLTTLNLLQTAYLIRLLKETKVIFKDENMLTLKRAGEAFSMLTGYSPDTLRIKMNIKGQGDLTYSDRKAVREVLTAILTMIDGENGEQKNKKF